MAQHCTLFLVWQSVTAATVMAVMSVLEYCYMSDLTCSTVRRESNATTSSTYVGQRVAEREREREGEG
jgi:hypothetical protein